MDGQTGKEMQTDDKCSSLGRLAERLTAWTLSGGAALARASGWQRDRQMDRRPRVQTDRQQDWRNNREADRQADRHALLVENRQLAKEGDAGTASASGGEGERGRNRQT